MPREEVFDREEVIKSAMNTFWKKGYNGTSMQDLVDATGLNRSSIYNSFHSKMSLFKLVLKEYQQENGEITQKALLRASNPVEALRFIFEAFLVELLRDKDNRGCLIVNSKAEMANQDAQLSAWLLADQKASLRLFEGLVATGQAQRLINQKEQPVHYAYVLYNAFQGLRITGITVKDKEVLQKIVDNVICLLE